MKKYKQIPWVPSYPDRKAPVVEEEELFRFGENFCVTELDSLIAERSILYPTLKRTEVFLRHESNCGDNACICVFRKTSRPMMDVEFETLLAHYNQSVALIVQIKSENAAIRRANDAEILERLKRKTVRKAEGKKK